MPRFRYKARTHEGNLLQGEVDAVDNRAAVAYVIEMGASPLEVKEDTSEAGIGDADVGELIDRYLGRPVPLEDLVVFARQLQSLLRAGVPIIRALRGLAENMRSRRLSAALIQIARDLEAGKTLGAAFNDQTAVFPPILRSMIRVGEASGQLETALGQMADNLEQSRTTNDRVRRALRYPSFVLAAVIGALAIVNLTVIPAFAGMFANMDAELPFSTRFLLGMSTLFVEHWLVMVVVAVTAMLAFRSYGRTEAGQYSVDQLKLRLPGVGSILKLALLARFARTLSMGIRSGLPILQSLNLVAEATDNRFISNGILSLRGGIERGDSLYAVCRRSGLFTPMVLQMMSVGEETGEMADLLDQVAGFYEQEVEDSLEKLSSYIEPLVIAFVGMLVAVLALGIFLPMWQMNSVM